jgi:hypothetical protein
LNYPNCYHDDERENKHCFTCMTRCGSALHSRKYCPLSAGAAARQ